MENTRAFAHQHGFVETILGRKLYLPDINSRTMMIQKASERMAINAPMQGTAADIIKLAMIKVDEWISTHHINVKMIMQVHDELVFEVAEPEASHAMHHIQELMQNALELHVPLIVAVGCGDNWDEAH
jgi:DNA polymerase-1